MIKGLNAQNKPAWRKGFWLGKSMLNDAAFVGTKVGIVTGRTVKRLPDSPIDVKGLYTMRGTPWNTGGARDVPRPRVSFNPTAFEGADGKEVEDEMCQAPRTRVRAHL